LAARVAVGAHDRVLGRFGDRRPVGGPVAGISAVDGADRLKQLFDRLGQVVVGRLQVGPQRVTADLGHYLVGERLDVEWRVRARTADVAAGRGALLVAERVYAPAVGSREARTFVVQNASRTASAVASGTGWVRSTPAISAPISGLAGRISKRLVR